MEENRFAAPFWSIFRIVIALLFTLHGLGTVFGVGNDAMPVGLWPMWWAGLIQVVCGVLVLLGALTRPAAILCSGSMAYAYFVIHQPQALLPTQNDGVSPALYAWAFLAIAVLGAGPWSLDAFLRRSAPARAAAPQTA